MSMSIPLVWDEVTWRPEWGAYRGRDIAGHAWWTAACSRTSRSSCSSRPSRKVTNVMGPKQNNPVLGLMIDESLEVPGAGAGAAAKQPGALAEFALVSASAAWSTPRPPRTTSG